MKKKSPEGFDPKGLPNEAYELMDEQIKISLEDNIRGPYCPWPKDERHGGYIDPNHEIIEVKYYKASELMKKKKKPGFKDLVGNLGKSVKQAVQNGGVSEEIRSERLETCAACPAFDPKFRRCGECGCFMDVKAKIGGDPSLLCPLNKWLR